MTQAQVKELEQLEAGAAAEEAQDQEGEFIPGETQPEPEQSQTANVLAPMLQITFGLIAARRGKHWALSDGEADEAGKAYGAVIDKYLPDVAMGPEVTAVMITLAIVGPRLGEDKRQEAKKAAAESKQDKESGANGDQSK